MYKKAVMTAAVLSMLTATGLAAPQESDTYMGLNTVPVEIAAEDTAVFKPAAIKSIEDYNEHYRLYKYDTISVRIIGFRDAQGLDNIMIGTDGYVNLPYAGSVKLAGLTLDEAKAVLTQKFS